MGPLRYPTVSKGLFKPRTKPLFKGSSQEITACVHIHTVKSQITFKQALSFSITIIFGFG